MSVTITSQPSDVTPVDGQAYSISVTATGNGTLKYDWFRYGEEFGGAATPVGTDNFKITIASPGDPGFTWWYECVITDDDPGSVTTRRAKKLPTPDASSISNANPSMNDCDSILITGTVLRYGIDTGIFYKWQRDEGSGWIDETGWQIQLGLGGADMVIPLVITTDNTVTKNGWKYRLMVSYDQINTDVSPTATLTVTAGLAKLATDGISLTIDVGNPLVLALFVSSCSPVTFAWLKGATTLVGEVGDTLTIDPVAASDTGVYTLKATNSGFGEAATSRVVTVNDPATNFFANRRRFYAGNQAN